MLTESELNTIRGKALVGHATPSELMLAFAEFQCAQPGESQMKIHPCKQGSDEWLQLRLGIPTSSEFDRVITPIELQPAAAAQKYLCVKLAEWIYGAPLEAFVSPWMERGKDLEAEAIRFYEMERNVQVTEVGLVTTDDEMAAASPDRLIGENGELEQKCPALETHVGYMLDPQSLVAKYRLQVQGQLWVCEREWSDMQSYYPGFPSVIVRVNRDEKVIAALARYVPEFVGNMLRCREKLVEMYGELRRERTTAKQNVEASRAAFDEFMGNGIGGVV